MLAESVGNTGDGAGDGAEDYILIRDEKTSGTSGGGFSSGIWRTRDLNTLVVNQGNHATLDSNQITLTAGTYKVKARALAFDVNGHKIKLYNITDSVNIVIGSNAYASSAFNGSSESFLEGRFLLTEPKIIELQHRCVTTKGVSGFGLVLTFGVIEVYAAIEFWKEG